MFSGFQAFCNYLATQNWVTAQATAQKKANAAKAAAQQANAAALSAAQARLDRANKELADMQAEKEYNALRRDRLRRQVLDEEDVLGGQEGEAQIFVPILG